LRIFIINNKRERERKFKGNILNFGKLDHLTILKHI
jgi:hypothetical protein